MGDLCFCGHADRDGEVTDATDSLVTGISGTIPGGDIHLFTTDRYVPFAPYWTISFKITAKIFSVNALFKPFFEKERHLGLF